MVYLYWATIGVRVIVKDKVAFLPFALGYSLLKHKKFYL